MQEKRRLLNQVDSLELALQIKADEVKELKGKLEAEVKGRLEDQDRHEQVSWDPLWLSNIFHSFQAYKMKFTMLKYWKTNGAM